jgi:hypothetical protein
MVATLVVMPAAASDWGLTATGKNCGVYTWKQEGDKPTLVEKFPTESHLRTSCVVQDDDERVLCVADLTNDKDPQASLTQKYWGISLVRPDLFYIEAEDKDGSSVLQIELSNETTGGIIRIFNPKEKLGFHCTADVKLDRSQSVGRREDEVNL